METSLVLLLLLAVLAHVGAGFPTERRGEKYASWDDVNVVAHGLLQLGQGLKEHVDKTKVQMRDVNAQLKALNGTVDELGRAHRVRGASRAGEEERRERLLEDRAGEDRAELEEMKADGILSRMDRLEEKVVRALREPGVESNYSDRVGVPFIQRMLDTQNRRIDDLVEKIKQQQDRLDKQNLHLQSLQRKVGQKRVKSHRRRDEDTALRGQNNTPTDLARDCQDLFVQGQRASGVYTVYPDDAHSFNVLCEMTSEGGWTVIQKRHNGSQSFNQPWEQYQKGFGSLNGEFWLGLENIHVLSKQGQYTLQVELSDWTGQEQSDQYQFRLDGEDKNYALHLEQASSPGGLENAMTTGASGLPFSTSDRDNDLSADVHCAGLLSGGWWFSSCGNSNLNGRYPRRPSLSKRKQSRRQAMFWTATTGHNSSLKTTVLKIAPDTIKQ
ncbi:angiopoietin-related protein 4-like [Polymixia lowei]